MNKKIMVRIAVAVSPNGMWNACGFSKPGGEIAPDNDLMSFAVDPLDNGEARYFIEAELEIPARQTIQAISVEKASGG